MTVPLKAVFYSIFNQMNVNPNHSNLVSDTELNGLFELGNKAKKKKFFNLPYTCIGKLR